MKRFYFLLLLLCLCGSFPAQATLAIGPGLAPAQDSLPVPKGIEGMMFYVQRDPNANTIVYKLNRTARGKLDEKTPIHAFWIRYADAGEHKELNYIQRKFAYGLNSRQLDQNTWELNFVSYSKLRLYLRRNDEGQYHIWVKIGEKEVLLERIFVRIEGGSFWLPNVLYVELKGKDAATGKFVTQRFKP